MECNEAKKPQVLYRILTGRKLADIAAELDVSVRSIQRWLDEPEFADAIREEHQAACRVAIAQARTEMAADLEEGQLSRTLLVKIRNDEQAPIHARIRCATLLMARADRWTKAFDKEMSKEAGREKPNATASVEKPRQKATENDRTNRGMGVSPMSTAAAMSEPPHKPQPVRQIDTHGPEVPVFDENRKSTHATKPRQNTTENDKTPRPDVPKCSEMFHSLLCDSAPLREPIQKPRQNTTKDDKNGQATQSAIRNPQSAMSPPPSQPLQNLAFSNPFSREKEQTLAKLNDELDKLNEIEATVTDAARSRNAQDSAAMHEFKAQVGEARAKLMDAILAVEEASAQDYHKAFHRTEVPKPAREAMSV